MVSNTENLILSSLITNETYARKVLPHLNEEYFSEKQEKILFDIINKYVSKYNGLPTKNALHIEASNLTLDQRTSEEIEKTISALEPSSAENTEYLVHITEKFCKDKAIFNAIMKSIKIADGSDKEFTPEAIPSILTKALAVAFDTSVGHDFIDDADARYEYYHRRENRIPSGLSILDHVSDDGFPRKTLNVVLAPPHAGKTLTMVNIAIGGMHAGYNVLYLTAEMAEEEIAKRFDVNLLNVDFGLLKTMSKQMFMTKTQKLKEKSMGKLKIKEFPTGTAHAGHFKNLIEDLRVKEGFIPDVLVVDYMNICASQRYKAGSSANSYTIVKAIGEELRALAIETNTCLWTATQTTRSGIGNSDIDMTNTSESIGVPAIADFMIAIIDSEELRKMNQLLFKQLKNRYKDKNEKERFVIGIDRSRMKLYDVEESAQRNISKATDLEMPSKSSLNIQSDSTPRAKPGVNPFNDIQF